MVGAGVEVAFELRPSVGMGQVVALPLVCSLGVADALSGSFVSWPSGVVGADDTPLADVAVSVRYDDGLVVPVSLALAEGVDAAAVEGALRSRVDAWSDDVARGRAAAGPLAPVLGELFDRTALMGEEVDALLPDGQPFASGRLAGLSVWGRVTLIVDGRELELSPEQARLRRAV